MIFGIFRDTLVNEDSRKIIKIVKQIYFYFIMFTIFAIFLKLTQVMKGP